jgi:hypothetical protein
MLVSAWCAGRPRLPLRRSDNRNFCRSEPGVLRERRRENSFFATPPSPPPFLDLFILLDLSRLSLGTVHSKGLSEFLCNCIRMWPENGKGGRVPAARVFLYERILKELRSKGSRSRGRRQKTQGLRWRPREIKKRHVGAAGRSSNQGGLYARRLRLSSEKCGARLALAWRIGGD